MKATQILYLLLFVGVIVCIVTSSHLLDLEGFQSGSSMLPVNNVSEPTIAPGVEPARLSIQAQPNSSAPGTLPFGPYGQMASVGSYQYQDPALLPAELNQMKQLKEDLRGFLVFEGPSVAANSDPTVQLPLTQLRADSRKLDQEISVLSNNPGIQSSLTQQNIADIQESLSFLQRKVRLFQTSGVVNTSADGKEGFQDGSEPKTRATKEDLQSLQTKIYAAILLLSSSGTTDPTVQARIKRLQDMYSAITDMINKLDRGIWTSSDIPLYKEDIAGILPNLADPSMDVANIFDQPSGVKLSPVEQQIARYVGEDNAKNVFNHLLDNGMFRVNMEMGYNVPGSNKGGKHNGNKHRMVPGTNRMMYEASYDLLPSATDSSSNSVEPYSLNSSSGSVTDSAMSMEGPYDTTMPGAEENNSKVGGLDWKNRTESICEQVRLRGLDPMDFGCIAKGSLMSPAYSWRGHAKMVCGRLNTTMDPNLPVVCGCPPQEWKGWTLF